MIDWETRIRQYVDLERRPLGRADTEEFRDSLARVPKGDKEWQAAFRTIIRLLETAEQEEAPLGVFLKLLQCLECLAPFGRSSGRRLRSLILERQVPSRGMWAVFFALLSEYRIPFDWEQAAGTEAYRACAREEPLVLANACVRAGQLAEARLLIHNALYGRRKSSILSVQRMALEWKYSRFPALLGERERFLSWLEGIIKEYLDKNQRKNR